MPTDKPMLNRYDVVFNNDDNLRAACNTIGQAVTLLRRTLAETAMYDDVPVFDDIEAFLQQFDGNGTGGDQVTLTTGGE